MFVWGAILLILQAVYVFSSPRDDLRTALGLNAAPPDLDLVARKLAVSDPRFVSGLFRNKCALHRELVASQRTHGAHTDRLVATIEGHPEFERHDCHIYRVCDILQSDEPTLVKLAYTRFYINAHTLTIAQYLKLQYYLYRYASYEQRSLLRARALQ